MKERVLCFGFNTEFQKKLIDAWTVDLDAKTVDLVLLSRKACPNVERHAETALESARRVPAGAIGERLKLRFLQLQYNWIYRKLEESRPDRVLIYNGLNGVNYLVSAACKELDLPQLYFERAPLQDRVQIDARGVNFQSSVPTDIQFYRSLKEDEFADYRGADYVNEHLLNNESSLSGNQDGNNELRSKSYVFCPLQVPRDTQVTVFGGWINGIPHLLDSLDEASRQLPSDIHVRIKEHPSSPISFAQRIESYDNPKLVLDNEHDVYDQVAHSQGVITINSSVGLEAFLFEKPVITIGKALYSFGEMTTRATDLDSLCDAMTDFPNLSWSRLERDRFVKFLFFWFPPMQQVLNKEYTPHDILLRNQKFQSLLEGAN
ncbi:MAG: hypothetical protein OXG15_12380 [Gammaproteobacteria bacterium]|nr:hypothetical protein [Gammaproteobacteria bacterium]